MMAVMRRLSWVLVLWCVSTLAHADTLQKIAASGRITLEGLDLAQWDPATLRRRVGVIFQDFVRYDMRFDENIGVGDRFGLRDGIGHGKWQFLCWRMMRGHTVWLSIQLDIEQAKTFSTVSNSEFLFGLRVRAH